MTTMLTGPRPASDDSAPHSRPRRRRVAGRSDVLRWVVGVVMVAAGLAFVLSEHSVRVQEAQLATFVVRHSFATDAMFATLGSDPVIGFTVGHGWFAAQATILSGSAFFAGAVALIGGTLLLTGRLSWSHGLAITAIGVVALAITGQLRLVLSALVMGSNAQPGVHRLENPFGVAALVVVTAGVVTLFFFAARSARRSRTA